MNFEKITSYYWHLRIDVLRSNREKIRESSDLDNKIIIINEILNLLRCDGENKANLSFIGGSKQAGNMAVNKNTVGKSKVLIINQSVTGLFETRKEIWVGERL